MQRKGKLRYCGDARRFNDNTAMAHNVLSAASAAGAKQIVTGSSLAVYGLFYPATEINPEYLPVDEKHPRRPHDPYGLSKLVAEEMCDSLSRKANVRIAPRFSGITRIERARSRQRAKNPVIPRNRRAVEYSRSGMPAVLADTCRRFPRARGVQHLPPRHMMSDED